MESQKVPITSIILELQALAMNRESDTTNLLRKALFVASKLGLDEFKTWINHELHGYDGNDVPKYREITAELKLRTPHNGLIPTVTSNQSLAEVVNNVEIRDTIGILDDLLRTSSNGDGQLTILLSAPQQALLAEMQNNHPPLPGEHIIERNQVAAIVDTVRTTVLEWALQLESEGIRGDGISFPETGRNKSMANSGIHIENFQGILSDTK